MGLFSTTHIHQQRHTEYVPYTEKVEVTEKRAPTDLSVKLLNEFEEKAKANIIAKVHLNNSFIDGVVVVYRNDIIHDRFEYGLKFKLNGKEIKSTGFLTQTELMNTACQPEVIKYEVLNQLLVNKFTETLAKSLAEHAVFTFSTIEKQLL